MGTFIRFFIRIIKTISYALAVLVFFILVYVISIQTLSYLSTEKFKNNESPPPSFRVVLEILEESSNQKRFICVQWDDFKEMPRKDDGIYVHNSYYWRREYKAYLSETNGWCQGMSSEFEVENIGPGRQTVRLRYAQEASKVENHYSVVDNKIVPLYFRKFMSADIAVDAFFISLILTPIFVFTFRFCVKRYKRRKA